MPPINEPIHNADHPGYKKVVLIAGALLLLIIAGIAAWYFLRAPKSQRPLTEEQQAQIIQKLDEEAAKAPLSPADRYQLVTGRAYPYATSTASSTATSTPNRN